MKNETKRNVTQAENKDKRNECRFCFEIPEDCSCSRGSWSRDRFLDSADMNRPGLDD
jgi:hypothetical protein